MSAVPRIGAQTCIRASSTGSAMPTSTGTTAQSATRAMQLTLAVPPQMLCAAVSVTS